MAIVRRAWPLIALAVFVGLPLAWLLVRGSWDRKAPPVPHRDSAPAVAGHETPSQEGLRLLGEGKPREALSPLRKASRLEPTNALILNNVCVAEIQVGEIGSAIRDCEQAIELAPSFQLARNNLAWAQAERRKLTASLEARTVARGAKSTSDWIGLGMGWYRLAEWDRSMHCFQQALQLEPKNTIALNDVGAALMEKQRPELASKMFKQALAIDPDNQLARNNLAWAQAELEKAKRPVPATR